ncbi:hypothetical protein Taro_029040 [Colocasia esculenta]|uniref:Uncharacterized protein n=1 Tax=Colocasia esculenta TaxID=4460 RepID=A0A843VS49_COLES|nr:hypothetical protein [Colocasia esculenta]
MDAIWVAESLLYGAKFVIQIFPDIFSKGHAITAAGGELLSIYDWCSRWPMQLATQVPAIIDTYQEILLQLEPLSEMNPNILKWWATLWSFGDDGKVQSFAGAVHLLHSEKCSWFPCVCGSWTMNSDRNNRRLDGLKEDLCKC